MKRISCLKILLAATMLTCIHACEEKSAQPVEPTPVPTDMPQIIESELLDIAGRDWQSLVDTLNFFATDMLAQGRTQGFGSDSVYYSLTTKLINDTTIVEFTVQDSLWLVLKAADLLRHVEAQACNTTVVYDDLADSTRISVQNIAATAPKIYPVPDDAIIPVEYRHVGVGYIGFAYFENTDYTVERYPVMYYYGDTRSFSFYENLHFLTLLDQSNQLIESVQ